MPKIKFGNNNEITQHQNFVESSCRSVVLLLYFLFCFVSVFFIFPITVANIAVIGVDQALVKPVLKKKLKGSCGLYTS